MRILYFSPRDCWPLTSGARLRDYHLARELSRHAQLTYLGFLRNGETQPWRGPMGAEQNVECLLIPLEQSYTPGKLLRGLTGPLPVTVLNYTTARMRAELTRTLADGNFDLVRFCRRIAGVRQNTAVNDLNGIETVGAVDGDSGSINQQIMPVVS